MKVVKNFDNGILSVVVKKLEQVEEIVSERPLEENEDFGSFHRDTDTFPITGVDYTKDGEKTPFIGSYTKNVGGFGITVTRKLK